MAHIWKDRVQETSTTTGTGDFTLAGAVAGFRTFASVCSTNDTVYYYIEGVDASGIPTGEWETGLGTYSAANTLTRTTVLDSSNSGSATNFSAGTKRVGLCSPAMAAGTRALISEVVTTSSATNVSFASIPQIFRDLEVIVRGRGTKSAANVDIRLRLNSDTGGNYDYDVTQLINTTTSPFTGVGQTSMYIGNIAAASATANIADLIRFFVGDYRGTTFHKAAHYEATLKTANAAANFYTERGSLWWRSTSAITQIDVFPSANGFVDNSVVSLYGLR